MIIEINQELENSFLHVEYNQYEDIGKIVIAHRNRVKIEKGEDLHLKGENIYIFTLDQLNQLMLTIFKTLEILIDDLTEQTKVIRYLKVALSSIEQLKEYPIKHEEEKDYQLLTPISLGVKDIEMKLKFKKVTSISDELVLWQSNGEFLFDIEIPVGRFVMSIEQPFFIIVNEKRIDIPAFQSVILINENESINDNGIYVFHTLLADVSS